jgi:hypothetical protein
VLLLVSLSLLACIAASWLLDFLFQEESLETPKLVGSVSHPSVYATYQLIAGST